MQKRRLRNELGDWDSVRYFLAVAATGSFSRAASALQADQSTVGRRIGALEARLGAKLFDRHAKGMRLTPAGLGMLEQASRMAHAVEAIERNLSGLDIGMSGIVRVTASDNLASTWLTPRLVEFQRLHPSIVIELISENRLVDLASREADIAIRMARPTEAKLVGQKVGLLRYALYASKGYLDEAGTPGRLDDLYDHRLIHHTVYTHPAMEWWRDLVSHHDGVAFRSNSSRCCTQAVLSGQGIGLLPTYLQFTYPGLVRLPVEVDCALDIWLVSHEETNKSARTRAVIDHIRFLFRTHEHDWFS